MKRGIGAANKVLAVILCLILARCGTPLEVSNRDGTTVGGSGSIVATITFNKAVDATSVVAGTTLMLVGGLDPNGAVMPLVWKDPSTLEVTSVKPWGEVEGGWNEYLVVLKPTMKAQDGSALSVTTGLCGNHGTLGQSAPDNAIQAQWNLGNCVLTFSVPS